MSIQFNTSLQLNEQGHLCFIVKVSVPVDTLMYTSALTMAGEPLTRFWGTTDEVSDDVATRCRHKCFEVKAASCNKSLGINVAEAKDNVDTFIAECQEVWKQYAKLCDNVREEINWFIDN